VEIDVEAEQTRGLPLERRVHISNRAVEIARNS
jgi:hypothetical protein